MPLKFDPAKRAILDRPSRRAILDPIRIFSSIGLEEGDAFGDIGCGTGYFSLPAAEIVGHSSIVFAIDIEPQMLLSVAEKVIRAALDNVRIVLSKENSIPLPDGLLDRALMANLLPELDDPCAFCGDVARLLKPSGTVAVIDWHKREMVEGPCQEIRIAQRDAIELCTQNALELTGEFVPGPYHYGFLLKKRVRWKRSYHCT